MKCSIIIPVVNEEANLEILLPRLSNTMAQGHEIIIVDGGNSDKSAKITGKFPVKYIQSSRGRTSQMNAGVSVATGEVFVFLHADTLPPDDFTNDIINACICHQETWGFFKLKLSGKNIFYRCIEFCMNIRSGMSAIATGDMCLFITRTLFDRVKGFPDIPLMEDIAICKLLKKITKPVILNSMVITSSRRWQNNGIIKTVFVMWYLRMAYYLGMNPARLARIYYG